jgi:hypothetical protein
MKYASIQTPSTIIPKPVWAIGFAIEQPLHVVALACPASGILKQLEHIAPIYTKTSMSNRFCP